MLTSFVTQFSNFLIAIYLTDQLIGNYQVAVNFAVLVAFFVQPVRLILFPAFSKIDAKKEPETLQNVFRSSVKYASLLIVPAAFMVMALSQPAVATLFGNKYDLSPLYLSLYTILFLFTAFGYLSSAYLIKSQGRTDMSLKLAILSSTIGLVLALILIPSFGIIGLIVTILAPGIPTMFVSLWWIKKAYDATIDLKISAKIIAASAISAMITYLIINYLSFSH